MRACVRACVCVYHTLRKIREKESINRPTYYFTHSVSVCVYVRMHVHMHMCVCVCVCICTLLLLNILAFVFKWGF